MAFSPVSVRVAPRCLACWSATARSISLRTALRLVLAAVRPKASSWPLGGRLFLGVALLVGSRLLLGDPLGLFVRDGLGLVGGALHSGAGLGGLNRLGGGGESDGPGDREPESGDCKCGQAMGDEALDGQVVIDRLGVDRKRVGCVVDAQGPTGLGLTEQAL